VLSEKWRWFWMRYAGISCFGKFSTWLASLFLPPYYARINLSRMNTKGYVSPKAIVSHPLLSLGDNIFIDDGVMIYQDEDGGPIELGDGVKLFRETIVQTGHGGHISIGPLTHIQPRCQLSAYKAPISIGRGVEIAPYCAFYPYSHGMVEGQSIRTQPLQSKGGITIEDDAWLSVGVIVLDGVRIGKGAVVGAGAVVTKDLPANSISAGLPARVIKMRGRSYKDSDVDPSKV
jgi:acetyltransferase-like isoleucine patch superfamily enzyme